MNILNSKTLTEAIEEIFKSENKFIADRKKLIESIIEKTNSIQNNNIDKVKNKNYLTQQYNSRNIGREEFDKKLKENTDSSNLIDKKISESRDFLFEEYKTKYENPININGFINKTIFLKNSVVYKESLEFKKEYIEGNFNLLFTFDGSKEKNVVQLTLISQDTNHLLVYIIINIELDKEINVISLIADTSEKRIHFTNFDESEESDKILSIIKEGDLLILDNKDKKDLFLMLYDANLDLSNAPLYKVFKDGLRAFQDIIKKELKVNKKIINKI